MKIIELEYKKGQEFHQDIVLKDIENNLECISSMMETDSSNLIVAKSTTKIKVEIYQSPMLDAMKEYFDKHTAKEVKAQFDSLLEAEGPTASSFIRSMKRSGPSTFTWRSQEVAKEAYQFLAARLDNESSIILYDGDLDNEELLDMPEQLLTNKYDEASRYYIHKVYKEDKVYYAEAYLPEDGSTYTFDISQELDLKNIIDIADLIR